MTESISRRSLVKGIGAAAAMSVAGAGMAFADEVQFDSAYDVVVVGMGFAGMTAAIAAADAGAKVLIVEAAPEELAGGNSKVCGQMYMNTEGDKEAAYNYIMALAAGRYLAEDRAQIAAEGIADIKRYIAQYGAVPSEDFTDAKDVLGMGASYPEFPGGDVVSLWCATTFYGQSFLWNSEKANVLDNYADSIEIWYESRATKLVQNAETKAVVGIVVEQDGAEKSVGAANGVVLACGGYEANARMMQVFTNCAESAGYGSTYSQGDGIKMAMALGAQLDHMVSHATGGIASNGYWVPDGQTTGALSGAAATGGMLSVGKEGRRWVNETATARYGMTNDKNGSWRNPRPPERTYAIYDKTQMDAIEEAGGLAGPAYDALTECATIEECAEVIGCDADTLAETIARYNEMAEAGQDTEYERDPETMRALDGESYYVLRLKMLVSWTLGGPLRDAKCQIIDVFDEPIPHLYGAGEMGNVAVNMYQSGLAVADCFIFGEIAGKEAAAAK